MKKLWVVPFAAILCVVIGYALRSGPSEKGTEYPYHHWATTGLQESIKVNGRDVFIVFTKDSDQGQRRSLWNYDGDDVVIEGVLHPKVLHTPDGPEYAQSEPYQEFKLIRWRRL